MPVWSQTKRKCLVLMRGGVDFISKSGSAFAGSSRSGAGSKPCQVSRNRNRAIVRQRRHQLMFPAIPHLQRQSCQDGDSVAGLDAICTVRSAEAGTAKVGTSVTTGESSRCVSYLLRCTVTCGRDINEIVAVGLLTRADIELLGTSFNRLWPVEEVPGSGELLAAIDDADRKYWRSKDAHRSSDAPGEPHMERGRS